MKICLVHALGHLDEREGEPGLVASEELSSADVVSNESRDNTEIATSFGNADMASKEA